MERGLPGVSFLFYGERSVWCKFTVLWREVYLMQVYCYGYYTLKVLRNFMSFPFLLANLKTINLINMLDMNLKTVSYSKEYKMS